MWDWMGNFQHIPFHHFNNFIGRVCSTIKKNLEGVYLLIQWFLWRVCLRSNHINNNCNDTVPVFLRYFQQFPKIVARHIRIWQNQSKVDWKLHSNKDHINKRFPKKLSFCQGSDMDFSNGGINQIQYTQTKIRITCMKLFT